MSRVSLRGRGRVDTWNYVEVVVGIDEEAAAWFVQVWGDHDPAQAEQRPILWRTGGSHHETAEIARTHADMSDPQVRRAVDRVAQDLDPDESQPVKPLESLQFDTLEQFEAYRERVLGGREADIERRTQLVRQNYATPGFARVQGTRPAPLPN